MNTVYLTIIRVFYWIRLQTFEACRAEPLRLSEQTQKEE